MSLISVAISQVFTSTAISPVFCLLLSGIRVFLWPDHLVHVIQICMRCGSFSEQSWPNWHKGKISTLKRRRRPRRYRVQPPGLVVSHCSALEWAARSQLGSFFQGRRMHPLPKKEVSGHHKHFNSMYFGNDMWTHTSHLTQVCIMGFSLTEGQKWSKAHFLEHRHPIILYHLRPCSQFVHEDGAILTDSKSWCLFGLGAELKSKSETIFKMNTWLRKPSLNFCVLRYCGESRVKS